MSTLERMPTVGRMKAQQAAEMIPGEGAELAVRERMTELRRDAERERVSRLVRSKRRGGRARRVNTLIWRDMASFIAPRMRLRRRSASGGLESLTRGERS
jgi:hypothetical protein